MADRFRISSFGVVRYVELFRWYTTTLMPFSQNLFPTQIENAITTHPAIRQAVAVAVPDKKYGEVVGAWLVREPGTSISKEEIRTLVAQRINPQVIRKPIYTHRALICLVCRMLQNGSGSWEKMDMPTNCQRQQVGRYRNSSYESGVKSWLTKELVMLGDLKAVDLSDDSGHAPLSLDIFLLSVYLNLVFNLAGNHIIIRYL